MGLGSRSNGELAGDRELRERHDTVNVSHSVRRCPFPSPLLQVCVQVWVCARRKPRRGCQRPQGTVLFCVTFRLFCFVCVCVCWEREQGCRSSGPGSPPSAVRCQAARHRRANDMQCCGYNVNSITSITSAVVVVSMHRRSRGSGWGQPTNERISWPSPSPSFPWPPWSPGPLCRAGGRPCASRRRR